MSEAPPSPPVVPRAAAVAGVAFALLFGTALLLVRMSIPGSIVERGRWLADPAGSLRLATHLLAWGGIAFLWFIGAVRTHIGAREDRFLASVYFGSGVLFLGMSFAAGAATQALPVLPGLVRRQPRQPRCAAASRCRQGLRGAGRWGRRAAHHRAEGL